MNITTSSSRGTPIQSTSMTLLCSGGLARLTLAPRRYRTANATMKRKISAVKNAATANS